MIPIYQIESSVYRGPAPETPEDIAALKEKGIQYVINLESGWFEFWHHRTDWEATELMKAGILPIRVHWSPILCPTRAHLLAVVGLVKRLSLTGGVYFHCLQGKDRTGLLAALYRTLFQGWKMIDAIQEMYRMGFHRANYFWWVWKFKGYFG